jgi:hypothetical protein
MVNEAQTSGAFLDMELVCQGWRTGGQSANKRGLMLA